jgi:hypothetical protein
LNDNVVLSFQQAVAASCEHSILFDSVIVTGAVNTTTASDSLRSIAVLAVLSEATVTYTVNQQVHGFTDSAAAYENITSTLRENVADNKFTSYLREFADANNATSLNDASVDVNGMELVDTQSPSSFPSCSPSSHPRHHKDRKLSDGDIAAIVIMGVFGIVCIVVGILYFTSARVSQRERGYDAPHAL